MFRTKRQSPKRISNFFLSAFVASRLIIFLLFYSTLLAFSENSEIIKAREIIASRGEVVVKFSKPVNISIQQISNLIYIDKIKNDTIWAYITKQQLDNFLPLGISFKVLEPFNRTRKLQLASSQWTFNKYPTYPEYVSMMDSFVRAYPMLCSKIEIGKTVKGNSIIFIRINPDTLVPKPSVMYSSTMHGDETGGYVLMLHLIDYLLKNYGKELSITKLVDSLDIWINPLANPDGTYAGGDSTVWGATRTNGNNIDLNRNFPDPILGNHPDGNNWQPETIEMIDLMKQHHFSLSANFHAGDEVVNYPWDCSFTMHVDSSWFSYISKEYADSSQHYGRANYFTSWTPNGITDGAQWYVIHGGRQDYITNFLQGREVTIELDITKTTPEDSLKNLWDYNYRSLLHYLEQTLYGIHGFATDSATGKPIRAKIELVGHDNDSSVVFSDSIKGDYYRLVSEGTYNLQVTASGYFPKEINNVSVNNRHTTYLDIALKPGKNDIPENLKVPEFSIYPNPGKDFINIKLENYNSASIEIFDITGKNVIQNKYTNLNLPVIISSLNVGIYFVKMQVRDKILIKPFAVVR
jgi:hypothetical protein